MTHTDTDIIGALRSGRTLWDLGWATRTSLDSDGALPFFSISTGAVEKKNSVKGKPSIEVLREEVEPAEAGDLNLAVDLPTDGVEVGRGAAFILEGSSRRRCVVQPTLVVTWASGKQARLSAGAFVMDSKTWTHSGAFVLPSGKSDDSVSGLSFGFRCLGYSPRISINDLTLW